MQNKSCDFGHNLSNIMSEPAKFVSRDATDNVKMPEKTYTAKNLYKEKYYKLSQAVKVAYLSIKRRIVKEEPNLTQNLKDCVPLQEDDETSAKKETLLLVQYVKKIYEKTIETKAEEKRKLIESNEKSVAQYEPLLQKLEAEVRKHIQVEHQMRIIIENQQDQIRELDKRGNNSKKKALEKDLMKVIDEKEKTVQELKAENLMLKEQLKKSQSEVQEFKSGLSEISKIVKGLQG